MAGVKKISSSKTMDVSKPGKTAPDTSARPVIVTHKPEFQDPMVKTEEAVVSVEPEKPKEPVPTHGNKVIQPLTKRDDDETNEPESEPEEKQQTTEEQEANKEAAVVEAVVEQSDLGKKNEKEQLDAEAQAKQEAISKLIESKKYFVPIGQVAHRRNQRVGITFVVLLLLLAGIYLAIDAGLLFQNIELPFDVIPN